MRHYWTDILSAREYEIIGDPLDTVLAKSENRTEGWTRESAPYMADVLSREILHLALRAAARETELEEVRASAKGLAESLRLLRAENDAIRAAVITPEVLSGASGWRKRFEDLDREFPARVERATAKLRLKLEKKKALISDLKGRIRNLLDQPS